MRLTPTEQRIWDVLSDGRPHRTHELVACLLDSQATPRNMRQHLSQIRAKIRASGEAVLCEIHNRQVHYRRVKLLTASTRPD